MLQKSIVFTFRKKVLRFYRTQGRNLPWRATQNPYHILVSEVMLQQTQVNRVIPYYETFIHAFPTIGLLANAAVQDVLHLWSGLGYNSRALRLHACAKRIESEHGGEIPEETTDLQKLPGIGSYTAGAIAAFAFDKPVVFFDTNIRRVVITELQLPKEIGEKELLEVLAEVLPKSSPREWYNALMDYGAMKHTAAKTNVSPQRRQSTFKGSDREVRGFLMKSLLKSGSVSLNDLSNVFPEKECIKIIEKMIYDGLPVVIDEYQTILLTRKE